MAGGIGPASSSSTGLITDKVYNNAVPSRIYWEQGLQRNQTVLVASIPAYDLVELNVSMGTVEYALRNDVNASCKILINNRTSEGQVSVVKIDILNSMDVYWKMNGNLVDVYIKATTGSYNYCTAVCQSSVLGVAKNKIIKLEISDNDVSQMNVAGAYYPNVFGYTNLDSLSTGVAELIPKSNLRLFDIGEDLSFTSEGSDVSKTIKTSVGGVWLVVISFRGDSIEHMSTHIFYNVGGNFGKSISTISNFNYTDKSSIEVSANDGYSGFTIKPTYTNPIYGAISVSCRKLNP